MTQAAAAVDFAAEERNADVRAALNFITPQDTKPAFKSSRITGGEPEVMFQTEAHAVEIRDMRPRPGDLSLDREGFVLRRHRSTVTDFYDDDAIAEVYYPEIEALLRRELGASRVIIFDTTRRSDAKGGAANPDGTRGPASRVHVDYTVTSGPKRIRDLVGDEEADRLFASGARIVQINVWRPITGPVRRSPLALADASSVRPEELVATDQIFPDRIGEIYSLAYAPTQRWYYAPEITPDEVILIKGWDSDPARARFTPHGAFALPNTPADAAPRESIELRTYAVIER